MSGPLDEFGYPAFACAADRSALEPVPGAEPAAGADPVLRCPTCGHRTDEPGAGTLADGFDVVHRQWGLRGDPHAWSALRDLVGSTPTPTTDDEVRQAFVDGLRDVADVDVDRTAEHHVYRAALDHGGMSGGGVNVDWWRSKGIPLLVSRSIARRPTAMPSAREPERPVAAPQRRSGRSRLADVVVWAVILAIPIALVGGGGWLLFQRAYGTRVEATVLECDTSGSFRRYGSTIRQECVAEWTVDGRTVIGGFAGGNGTSDVGRTVDATVRGETAYSRSLGLPVLLILLGLPFLLLPAVAIRGRRRRDRAGTARPGAPAPTA